MEKPTLGRLGERSYDPGLYKPIGGSKIVTISVVDRMNTSGCEDRAIAAKAPENASGFIVGDTRILPGGEYEVMAVQYYEFCGRLAQKASSSA